MELKAKSKSFDSINLLENDEIMPPIQMPNGCCNNESEKQFRKLLQESRATLVQKLEEVEQRLYLCKTKIGRHQNEEKINMVAEKLGKDLKTAIHSIDELDEALDKSDKLDLILRAGEPCVKKAKSKEGFWSKFWSKFCCGKSK